MSEHPFADCIKQEGDEPCRDCVEYALDAVRAPVTSPAGQTEEFKRDSLYWHKTVLTGKFAHWCNDWDGLPIDETCDEFTSCHDCYGRDPAENAEIDNLKERLRLDRPAQIC